MRQRCILFLLAINFLLWALLVYLLSQHPFSNDQHESITLQQPTLARKDNALPSAAAKAPSHAAGEEAPKSTTTLFDGVAATLVLKSPKWFQRRYTAMIHNALNAIPPTWAVQIFVAPHPQAKEGITSGNVGLQRLIESNPRVFVTEIDNDIWNEKQKPKLLLVDRWIWEQMKAENVFLFSGNGAICGNSHFVLQNFTSLDYVGIPWWRHDHMGGDGSTHSLRKKSVMIDVLKYTSDEGGAGGKPYDGNEREDIFYVRNMIEMNQKGLSNFQLASSEQTEHFGGTSKLQSAFGDKDATDKYAIDKYEAERIGAPLVLSGTLPNLSYHVRDTVLELCPEIKVIFPALHDPHCFGAKPDGEKCAESICALRDSSERKGGC